MRKLFSTTVPLFLLVLLTAIPALAQNNKGAIVGSVKDPNDALVSKAQVKVTSVKTGEVREAETSDDGTFTVTNLEPGPYNVSVEASGFQTVTVEAVQVETNSRLPLDVKFANVTTTSSSVTISADAAPLVESETSVRGDLITGRQVTDLPIPQRNFTLLAGLSPGVTRPNLGLLGGGGNFVEGGGGQNNTESTRFRESGGSVLVINGARATNNNFTLDGVDNNESQFGQIAIYPQPDAIAEFKIESSVPSAESGRAGGGIISTTFKSGGNDVHGTVGEIYQGRFLSAAAAKFDDPNSLPVPNYVTHNFYGTVGGPIFLPRPGEGGKMFYNGRNRSFFFFSLNGQRNSTPIFNGAGDPQAVPVPTARMRVGDFGELLQPGVLQDYAVAGGGTISAPKGTIFAPNGTPIPGNDLRNCASCGPFSPFALAYVNAFPLPNTLLSTATTSVSIIVSLKATRSSVATANPTQHGRAITSSRSVLRRTATIFRLVHPPVMSLATPKALRLAIRTSSLQPSSMMRALDTPECKSEFSIPASTAPADSARQSRLSLALRTSISVQIPAVSSSSESSMD
jgi:hypothetical protein